jgi:predicted nucleotide-binding protein
MDKKQAIEYLRERLGEIPTLVSLPYNNDEYPLWRNQIEDVLDVVFGRESSEYQRFASAYSRVSTDNYQGDYRTNLKLRETAILTIIKKYETLGFGAEPANEAGLPPKAFIAHGGRSGVLDKLREFVEALGIKPVIVELSPTRGMTVDAKVNTYIKDADCGIVLATKGGIVDTKGIKPKQHPRLNVVDELERLRAAFPEKTILLVERGVDLPSNISGLTYEPFVRQSMDRAFTAIARELTEFGILRAVKPLS